MNDGANESGAETWGDALGQSHAGGIVSDVLIFRAIPVRATTVQLYRILLPRLGSGSKPLIPIQHHNPEQDGATHSAQA